MIEVAPLAPSRRPEQQVVGQEPPAGRGLTAAEAAGRLARWGPNEIETGRRYHVLRTVLAFSSNPLVLILLAAADIILLEKSLAAIYRGVIEGRKSFGNLSKYVLMGSSSNFGNMLSMAASAFLPFLPMLPVQILLNNFLYNLSQLAIPTDNVDASYVARPRKWDMGMIQRFMFGLGPISSLYDFLTFGVMLWVFYRLGRDRRSP
jgi:magnesium-transporting ATPase (P-type)